MKVFGKIIHFAVMSVATLFAAAYVSHSESWIISLAGLFVVLACWYAPYSKREAKPMTGHDFEHHCAKWLLKRGFRKITVTPASGDYGADLVAIDRRRHKWVVQCKYYKGKVGNAAVQEIVAAKAHYGADRAAVMTNSVLTEKARQLAKENDVELFESVR